MLNQLGPEVLQWPTHGQSYRHLLSQLLRLLRCDLLSLLWLLLVLLHAAGCLSVLLQRCCYSLAAFHQSCD
jgi:hypothetical protein